MDKNVQERVKFLMCSHHFNIDKHAIIQSKVLMIPRLDHNVFSSLTFYALFKKRNNHRKSVRFHTKI